MEKENIDTNAEKSAESEKVLTFLHSGDMGDIIASLCAVKEKCKMKNAKARIILDATGGIYDPFVKLQAPDGLEFNRKAAEFLKPLIEAQPFVAGVGIDDVGAWTAGCRKPDYNLNVFRRYFIDAYTARATGQNLVYLHQVALGLGFGYKGDWLEVDIDKEPEGVVVARSNRYQSGHLIWESLLRNMARFGMDYSFIGTDLEFECFKDCFRFARPKRIVVKDALEMAKAVGESKSVIVNGTLLYWVAVGLGHADIFTELGDGIMTTHFKIPDGDPRPRIKYFQGARLIP